VSNYTKSTNFTAKDSLPPGDSSKIIRGSEFDTEFNAIQAAVNSKSDTASPTFTGTVTINGVALTATGVELNYTDGVTSSIQTQLNAKAPIASPTFTGTVTLPAVTETVYAITGTTPAISASNGTIQTWTLSANSTPTDSLLAGQSVVLHINDGSAYTITWTSLIDQWKTNSGSAPVLATTGETVIVVWKVGTTVYGARVGNN